VVVAGNVEPFPFAHILRQLVRLGKIVGCLRHLAGIDRHYAQARVGHGKVRIQFGGTQVVPLCLWNVMCLGVCLIAQRIGAKSLERRGRSLAKGCIQLLDAVEVLAQLPAHRRSRVVHALALPTASSTCSLSGACACSLTISSPVAVFCAERVITYCWPRLAMVPVMMALMPSRSPISRAIAGVTGVPSGLPRYFTLCKRCCGLTILMTGDCSRSICSAWFNVVSNTGSPVWLTKSARMSESFFVASPV